MSTGTIATITELTVVWGEEHFSLGNYSGFRIGPFSITIKVESGQDPALLMQQAHTKLEAMALKMFLEKRNGFGERYAARANI